MKNFVLKFNTISGPQRVTMSHDELMLDSELAPHVVSILQQESSGVVGKTVNTQTYGRVEINLEGFEN